MHPLIRQGAVPMWHWDSNHIGVLKSTIPDAEWTTSASSSAWRGLTAAGGPSGARARSL